MKIYSPDAENLQVIFCPKDPARIGFAAIFNIKILIAENRIKTSEKPAKNLEKLAKNLDRVDLHMLL